MAETCVELSGAAKRYGAVEALKPTDLRIQAGEVVAVLGPNGAGKTTAISLMIGLRKPTAGRARLFGLDPHDRRARSRMGAMLQESGTTTLLSVAESVDLFRSYYPRPMAAARAIELAGLGEKARARIGSLSGGQRQRLYFALAICGDPDLLFLDEPTVAMDVEGRRSFLDSIREFARAGKTIVLTTHYLEEADALAERVIVVNHGAVIADATPAEIKSRVAGRRLAFRIPGGAPAGLLDGLPVSGAEVEGEQVRALSNQPEEVLAALFRRGIPIVDLEVTGADLEEAFLILTGRAA